jgi:DNA-binding XRE family transcriptional regulator
VTETTPPGVGADGAEPPQGDTAPREPSEQLLESDCELTSYRELATVLESLPLLLREARRWRRLSQRAIAPEIGISYATVSRIEAGGDCTLPNAIAVLRWLDRPEGT